MKMEIRLILTVTRTSIMLTLMRVIGMIRKVGYISLMQGITMQELAGS